MSASPEEGGSTVPVESVRDGLGPIQHPAVPVESVRNRPGPVKHLAVDLGASGGRVALGTIADGKLGVEILHRWPHAGVPVRGQLYWDILAIWNEILRGLRLAPEDVASVGVNSWGVDYGLIDPQGNLLEGVHHYRCARTNGWMDTAIEKVGRERIYEATGIQFMPINTVYQILAQQALGRAAIIGVGRLLNVPDLIHYWLSGVQANERTIASTSQLYDPRSGDWAWSLMDDLRISKGPFEKLSDPGTILGLLSQEVAAETGLPDTKVVLPASHDTASAVAAVPAQGDDWAYISSGTWSLVGIETPKPVISPEALAANLTNEAGYGGTTRLLKNIMGLWILQECRRAWGDVSFDELYAEAEAVGEGPTFDPDDARFLAPGLDMPDRVRSLCGVEERAAITRAIFDSLAWKTNEVLSALERVSGKTIRTIHIVGGGSQIDFLNRLIAKKTGRTVVAGPVEATLIGNLLVQAEACGSIERGTIRDVVRNGTELKVYAP